MGSLMSAEKRPPTKARVMEERKERDTGITF